MQAARATTVESRLFEGACRALRRLRDKVGPDADVPLEFVDQGRKHLSFVKSHLLLSHAEAAVVASVMWHCFFHPSECVIGTCGKLLARMPRRTPVSALHAYIGISEPGRPGSSIRLRRIAFTTATVRLVVPSFRIAFLIWKLTVFSLMFSIIPISQDDFPSAVHRRQSLSRTDRSTFAWLFSSGPAISVNAM